MPRLSALVILAASLWVLLNLRWCLFVIVRHVTPLRTELEYLLEESHVDEVVVDARAAASHSRPSGIDHTRQSAGQRVGRSAQPTAKGRVQPAHRSEPSHAGASGVAPSGAGKPYHLATENLFGIPSVSGGSAQVETRAASVGGGVGGGGGSAPNPDDAAAALLASKCALGDARACNNRVEVRASPRLPAPPRA